jgi:hypothetical protein
MQADITKGDEKESSHSEWLQYNKLKLEVLDPFLERELTVIVIISCPLSAYVDGKGLYCTTDCVS